ncbi:MAG TPA: ornithine carbamoyltransferase [Thermoanaerobaculia bacterium]|nr:ornithine carbamoyltransferase [Thermoanaerobaculia bacterium]
MRPLVDERPGFMTPAPWRGQGTKAMSMIARHVSPPVHVPARHLLSIADLAPEELRALVETAVGVARGEQLTDKPLAGKVVGIYFRKSSTRTRTSFTVGAMKLGASVVTYGPNDLQLSTGETLADTGRVLANYLDVLVVRTNEPVHEMRELANQEQLSIVNAMSAEEHPTQVIADLAALLEALGSLAGTHLLFIGEGNNTAAALALAVAKTPGMRLTLVTPAGYGLPDGVLAEAKRLAGVRGAAIIHHHDMRALPQEVDAVYTTRWLTMGVPREGEWLDHFRPYTVTPAVMAQVSKSSGTIFLHDLPAMRGYEVVDEVLDGPQSIAFRQAFHKMTSAMAVLAWCTGVLAAGSRAALERAQEWQQPTSQATR